MRLTPIPAEKVDTVWPRIATKVWAACQYSNGSDTAEGLREKVKGNDYVLVLIDDDMPLIFQRHGDLLHVVSVCGRDIVRRFDEFAGACFLACGYVGCKRISWNGRKGWAKLSAPYGVSLNEYGDYEVTI